MPMNHHRRPRVIVNGVQRTRTYHYYWCRQCQRSIRTTTTNPAEILCPRCLRQIRHELDVSRPRPLLLQIESRHLEPSPGRSVLDALVQMLDPNPRDGNSGPTHQAWILLQFIGPDGDDNRGNDDAPPMNEELVVQELTQNDRSGPEAAPEYVIRALPVVELTGEHLKNDLSHCPICRDEFEIGVGVRELPCKHFYHSECIVPWLQIRSTCPVCRHEIGGLSNDDDNNNFHDGDDDFEGFRFGEEEGEGNWSWMEIFSLRPFTLVLNFAQLWLHFLGDRLNNVPRGRGGSSTGTWWRSWGIPFLS